MKRFIILALVLAVALTQDNIDLSSSTSTGLTTSKGFSVLGETRDSQIGWRVYGIGDFNRDGVNDYAIATGLAMSSAAQTADQKAVYIIFGKGSRTTSLDLLNLATTDGIKVVYATALTDTASILTIAAGDHDGDGASDVFIGVPGEDGGKGAIFAIYGWNQATTALASTGTLPIQQITITLATNAFTVTYDPTITPTASTIEVRVINPQVSAAAVGSGMIVGKLNADAIDEFCFSASGVASADIYCRKGQTGRITAVTAVGGLASGTDGWVKLLKPLAAAAPADASFVVGTGHSMAYIGKSLGGAALGFLVGTKVGTAVMVKKFLDTDTVAAWPATDYQLVAADLQVFTAGAGTLAIHVAPAGDVNADGVPDFLIGSPDVVDLTTPVKTKWGVVWVVFGLASGTTTFDATITALGTGTTAAPTTAIPAAGKGCVILGATEDYIGEGWTMAQLGDFNKDTFGDIALGAPGTLTLRATANKRGRVLVIYGKTNSAGWPQSMDLTTALTAAQGITITSTATQSGLGSSVSGLLGSIQKTSQPLDTSNELIASETFRGDIDSTTTGTKIQRKTGTTKFAGLVHIIYGQFYTPPAPATGGSTPTTGGTTTPGTTTNPTPTTVLPASASRVGGVFALVATLLFAMI